MFELWADDARAFIHGNVIEGQDEIAKDNAAAVGYRAAVASDGTQRGMPTAEKCLRSDAVRMDAAITTHSAEEAYQLVVAHGGAIAPKRDAVDNRIISDVKNRSGAPINSQADVGGWPELKSTEPPADADRDGMPDEWEKARGLNPADGSDGAKIDAASGYSNVELYLNELAEAALATRE